MQKTVELAVGKTLERPPLHSCGRYYKLYLPKGITVDTNRYKLVNLSFIIKVPDNIISYIISNTLLNQQPLDIIGEFVTTDGRYKEVINKTQYFSFKFPKNTEIAKLYLFTLPGKKNYTAYRLEQQQKYGRAF